MKRYKHLSLEEKVADHRSDIWALTIFCVLLYIGVETISEELRIKGQRIATLESKVNELERSSKKDDRRGVGRADRTRPTPSVMELKDKEKVTNGDES